MFVVHYFITDQVKISGVVFVDRKPQDHGVRPFLFTPKFHLLQYFIEADRYVVIRGKKKHIGDAHIMFSCANESYQSIRHLKTTKAINIQFTTRQRQEYLSERGQAPVLEKSIGIPFIHNMSGHNTIRSLFEELLYLSSATDQLSLFKMELLLKQILVEIAIFHDRGPLKAQQGFLYTIKCLEKNYHLNYKIDHLADMANMSRSSYIRAFKKQTGLSVAAYAMKVKIRAACLLLATEPGLKVKDISDRLGFCDEFYFSNTFKKYMGKSPRQFRR